MSIFDKLVNFLDKNFTSAGVEKTYHNNKIETVMFDKNHILDDLIEVNPDKGELIMGVKDITHARFKDYHNDKSNAGDIYAEVGRYRADASAVWNSAKFEKFGSLADEVKKVKPKTWLGKAVKTTLYTGIQTAKTMGHYVFGGVVSDAINKPAHLADKWGIITTHGDDAVGGVKEFFKQIPGRTVDEVKDVGHKISEVYEKAKNIVKSIPHVIASGFNIAKDACSKTFSFCGDVLEKLKDLSIKEIDSKSVTGKVLNGLKTAGLWTLEKGWDLTKFATKKLVLNPLGDAWDIAKNLSWERPAQFLAKNSKILGKVVNNIANGFACIPVIGALKNVAELAIIDIGYYAIGKGLIYHGLIKGDWKACGHDLAQSGVNSVCTITEGVGNFFGGKLLVGDAARFVTETAMEGITGIRPTSQSWIGMGVEAIAGDNAMGEIRNLANNPKTKEFIKSINLNQGFIVAGLAPVVPYNSLNYSSVDKQVTNQAPEKNGGWDHGTGGSWTSENTNNLKKLDLMATTNAQINVKDTAWNHGTGGSWIEEPKPTLITTPEAKTTDINEMTESVIISKPFSSANFSPKNEVKNEIVLSDEQKEKMRAEAKFIVSDTVLEMQKMLNQKLGIHIEEDGKWGAHTTQALIKAGLLNDVGKAVGLDQEHIALMKNHAEKEDQLFFKALNQRAAFKEFDVKGTEKAVAMLEFYDTKLGAVDLTKMYGLKAPEIKYNEIVSESSNFKPSISRKMAEELLALSPDSTQITRQ